MLRLMKQLVYSLCLLFCFVGFSQKPENTIKGKVTNELKQPLVRVNVSLKNQEKGVITDENGKYVIKAYPKDIIVFSHTGMQPVEIIVQDVTSVLNIEMQQAVEELEEVVVTKRKNRLSQKDLSIAYAIDSTIVNTSLGYLNPKTVFYEFYSLSAKDLKGERDILDALQAKIGGVRVQFAQNPRTSTFEKAVFLSGSTVSAIFEIDGQLLLQTPTILDINDVLRIGVMYGAQARFRFGKIAAGGVIFINTKAGIHGAREGDTDRPYDRAKLRDNVYANNAISKAYEANSQPTYLDKLNKSSDFETAKAVFLEFDKIYKNRPYFYLDAYRYFMEKGHQEFANDLISEQNHLFTEHPVYAKALAYHYDLFNEVKKANALYEDIFKQRPSYIQSYRDLAQSYIAMGNFKKATRIYARHNYLIEQGLFKRDSMGIQLLMERESDNLVTLKGKHILKNSKQIGRSEKFVDFKGARLLFEWNDSDAEFELKFVNPQSHFYSWLHTRTDNLALIQNEKRNGYSCEEFLMDGSLPGTWQVNVTYKGNMKSEPTYMKVTVFNHYGESVQAKEIKTFRLSLKHTEQKLFTMSNMGKLVAN